MKIQSTLVIATGILLAGLTGCNQGQEQITALESQVSEQETHIGELTDQNTGLVDQVHSLEGQVEKYENDTEAPVQISKDEKEIMKLVVNVHKGWELVPAEKNSSVLLQYFLPVYTTNGVAINTDNLPTIRRHDQKNFEAHLDAIMEMEGLSLKFGEPQFFYTEVKGDVFATCYRTLMRVYDNGKLRSTASVVSLLSGPKREEGWKVANYSWITFAYGK